MKLRHLRHAAVCLSAVISIAVLWTYARSSAAVSLGGVVGYSATELPNPLRGQHLNLLTTLFPQANSAQSSYAAWPGSFDRSMRVEWKTLQPKDPRTLGSGATDAQKFDFSAIDSALATAASNGQRLGLRITSFNSCCASSYPNNVDASVPDWLRGISGTTASYSSGGVTYVIPDWNNSTYLDYFTQLLTALGTRYNKDERLGWFEMSGYGDWSENHVAFMRDTLGRPGPQGDASVTQLGYWSQYSDQYITKASVARLVDANLNAFKDTQIVLAPGNPEMVRLSFRDSTVLPSLARPVGSRSDCLGAYSVIPSWATDTASRYVSSGDALVGVMKDQWKKAPIVTEWCNFLNGTTKQGYYEGALREVVNNHVSVTSSTGFPDQYSSSKMDATLFGLWTKANKYAGYRFAATGAVIPNSVNAGVALPISVDWTNFGSAPLYERWQVQYELRNSAGTAVKTVTSAANLLGLAAAQNFTNLAGEPASTKITDSLSIATTGLAAGNYTLVARVVWNEHKSGGTNAVNFAPMALAQSGRDSSGAYAVGTFTVASVATTTVAATTTTTVPTTTTTTTTTTKKASSVLCRVLGIGC